MTSMPGATLPPPAPLSALGGSTVNTDESGARILIRRWTVSLLRMCSTAVYFASGSNDSKTTSGGDGWKSGSSSGTIESVLCVYSDMFRISIISGRLRATGCRTVPFSSAISRLGVFCSGSGSSAWRTA